MANIFGDMRIDNVTPKEFEAMRTILNSDRAAIMLKELNKAFATLDSKAPLMVSEYRKENSKRKVKNVALSSNSSV